MLILIQCPIDGWMADLLRSMIILATIFLNIGHPGLIFDPKNKTSSSVAATAPTGNIKDEQYSSSDEVRENSSAAV
jgi:hypothetical protein